MVILPVTVDTRLRFDGQIVGHELLEQIFDELTIPNPEREYAERAQRYGWASIPEEFYLYGFDGSSEVDLPRGYALQLKLLLREHGIRVKWVNRTTWREGEPYGRDEFEFRPHQPRVIRKIRKHRQGIYKAPTGSGKTVAFCGFLWRYHPDWAIILVDRKELLYQWRDRIAEHIGIDPDEVGIIGDGKWSEGRITVSTLQTLHKERDKLKRKGWFDKWSFMLHDECHHAVADTYRDTIELFPARVRCGTSATPEKSRIYEIVLNVLGEIFCEDDEQELMALGVIERPHVQVVYTDFDFPYHGDIQVDIDEECDFCGRKSPHRHYNNYQKLKNAIVEDEARNELIVDTVLAQRAYGNHHQLVTSNEIRHLDAIMRVMLRGGMLVQGHGQDYVFKLTGKMTSKQRAKVLEQVKAAEECVLFSTVAGEGLDLPQLDRVHLVWPESNPKGTEQKIGRVRRSHDGKGDIVIFDYADTEVGVLAKQFRNRRYKCYDRIGLEVIM